VTQRIEVLKHSALDARLVGEIGGLNTKIVAENARIIEEVRLLRQKVEELSGYRHHVVGHVLGFALLVAMYFFITFAVAHEPTVADFLSRHT
jgi:hypothetical protein